MNSPEHGKNAINIEGNITGSQFNAGDNAHLNMSGVQAQSVALPDSKDINIQTELSSLREVLASLETPDRRKINNALDEAEDELKKPEPDKGEVGKAVDRALDYAKKAQSFVEVSEKLKPTVTNVAAWLGENWYKLLTIL